MIVRPLRLFYALFFCISLVGCKTQPDKIAFPFDETLYKKPISVKAKPNLSEIPTNLPNAKYTTQDSKLVLRKRNIPLAEPVITKASKPVITVDQVKRRKIPANLEKRRAGAPKKVKAIGKKVPAKGKFVMAEQPISKPYILNIARDDDKYGIRYMSQDQNLPGTYIYVVLEDSHGRIWIGTDNGLALLDGEELIIYTTQEGLSSNRIVSLLESSTGAIWIGTDGGGVDVFESGFFIHYGVTEGLSSNNVSSLLESSDGAIWIGTYGGGVDVYESGHFTHYGVAEGLTSNRVRSLLQIDSGAIWIATDGGGVNIFDSGNFLHFGIKEGLSSARVRCLIQSSTGAIWIGTDGGGLDVFDSGSLINYGTDEGLNRNHILSLLETSNGAIWIGTFGGVSVLESGSITRYDTEDGLSSNSILSLLESSKGAIWIGTARGGVNVFDSGSFTHYGTEEGLSSNSVRSLLATSLGELWIGTIGGGVDVFNSGNFSHFGSAQGLSSNSVLSLLETSSGAIWIGTDGEGLDLFKGNDIIHYGKEQGLSSNRVLSLLESSTGAIWIGTSGGVNVLESGKFTHYTTAEGLSSNYVLSIIESSTGAIWIGTEGNGVDVFESGRIMHYGKAEGLSSNRIRSLLESSTGAIWIGTARGGLDIFEDGRFTHYGTAEGLADNAVTQLAMDGQGNVWAGTGKGITRFVAKNDGYQLTTWNKSHGFKYMDFNSPGNPLVFTKPDQNAPNGTMWSGVGGVLTAFEPAMADTLKPALFITGLHIGQKTVGWNRISDIKEKIGNMDVIKPDTLFFPDKDSFLLFSNMPLDNNPLIKAGIRWSGVEDLAPYNLPKNLELPFDQNYVTFHYSGMKLSEQFDIVYRYTLEGMDKKWSSFTREDKASYRNIAPGEYIFRVRARGRNFLWSEEASVSFVVHPPWWLTWWAFFIYGFLMVIVVIMIVKLNTYRLVQQKRQLAKTVNERTAEVVKQKEEIELQAETLMELNATKDKFFSIISHDLKGPLTSLSSFIYILRDHIDSLTKEQLHELIQDLDKSQKNVSVLLENLLSWALSQTGKIQFVPEKFDLTALLQENQELLETQAANKKLTLRNTATTKLVVNANKNSISTVVRNLISNAIKFTHENGTITLGWKKRDTDVVVYIADTGVGMEPAMVEKIFSIGNTHSKLGTADEKGTGLGLMLCKEFVEKNGGKIWITSEKNVGSRFMFSIPMNTPIE